MRLSNRICILLLIPVLLLSQIRFIFASKKPYIVYLGSHADGRRHLAAGPQNVTRSHHDLLFSVLQRNNSHTETGDRLIYSYNKIFDGFAAVLHEEEVKELTKHPNVVSVFESKNKELQTTRSWDFLGVDHYLMAEGSIWNKDHMGEDIIIANIDSGVRPESKSFTDEGFGPIPRKFKGSCDNENDPTFRCNRKLIGARYFFSGFAESLPPNITFNSTKSPRDTNGHGTHTLSTAGGNFIPGANYHGLANGTARGGSPRARVVAYKICWIYPNMTSACNEADLLAAFEAAIDDHVDIISVSVGGGVNKHYLLDSLSIGSFHAVKNGIIVVAAGGNDGPHAETISNVPPWILTVAASTIDREFTSHIKLGNKQNFKGVSMGTQGLDVDKFYPLISGADANNIVITNTTDSLLCKSGTLDPVKVNGKILVCLRGGNITDKAIQAKQVGAIAMILANDKEHGYDTPPLEYALPTSHVNYKDGLAIFYYIKSSRSSLASLTQAASELGIKPAPIMASFSSRGPNKITPEILKPDITAPGVGILVAYYEDPRNLDGPSQFRIVGGTSTACPHVSGIAGLLKNVHRDWSPSAIKSAIITTASPLDNTQKPIRDSDMNEATPFAYGSGHVNPNQAMDPGLVYDMNHHDYLNFLCAIGYNKEMIKKFSKHSYYCPEVVSITNFNYPSIVIPNLSGQATAIRRMKNVGPPGTYSARIEAPVGVSIIVEPNTMLFTTKGQEMEYKLIFTAYSNQHLKDYSFGSLVWSDGKHIVRSPIVVKGKL